MKRVSVLLVLLATVLVTLPPNGALGTTKSNGRIVFSRYDPAVDDNYTYIVESDGSVQPLFPAFTSGSPQWSPDGRRVAVISGLGQQCLPTTCTGNTVIIDPIDGTWHALPPVGMPEIGTFCSLWSPNGTTFACQGGNDSDASVNGIYTIRSTDGGGLTRITDAVAWPTSRSRGHPAARRSCSRGLTPKAARSARRSTWSARTDPISTESPRGASATTTAIGRRTVAGSSSRSPLAQYSWCIPMGPDLRSAARHARSRLRRRYLVVARRNKVRHAALGAHRQRLERLPGGHRDGAHRRHPRPVRHRQSHVRPRGRLGRAPGGLREAAPAVGACSSGGRARAELNLPTDSRE